MELNTDVAGLIVVTIVELDMGALWALVTFSLVNKAANTIVNLIFEPVLIRKCAVSYYIPLEGLRLKCPAKLFSAQWPNI